MASALHAMGFTEEAKSLALEESISGRTVDLVKRAVQCVRKLFHSSNLVMKKVFATACSVDQVTQEDPSWPMVLILQTSDGSYGSHAISIWNRMIFDSNCPYAMRWSQRSLDWCSGKDSTCIGFSKVYRLCPDNFGGILPDQFGQMWPHSTIRVGTQVRSHAAGSDTLGWVRRLPTFRKTGEQKKGFIVSYTDGTMDELSHAEVCNYELKK